MQFNPEPIHENCKGCARVVEATQTCSAYEKPKYKWETREGIALVAGKMLYCPLATHFKLEVEKTGKVNPLKASKRAAGKK
jgi:hypothetical protein